MEIKPKNANFILVILLVVASFVIGSLYTKVQYLENNGSSKTLNAQKPSAVNPTVQPNKPAAPKVDIAAIKGLFKKDLIKFGDENKKLLFVEFADPSCPYCHAAAGKNPELSRQIGDRFKLSTDGGTYVSPVVEMKKLVDSGKAAFVFIYQNGHGNGEMATKALYCAYEQKKFWEAHDKLMTNEGYNLINNEVKNDKANSPKLVDFLSGVVDSSSLKSCLDSGKYDSRITSDAQTARELGVNGTPGFFINASNFAGAYNWTDMKSAAEEALK